MSVICFYIFYYFDEDISLFFVYINFWCSQFISLILKLNPPPKTIVRGRVPIQIRSLSRVYTWTSMVMPKVYTPDSFSQKWSPHYLRLEPHDSLELSGVEEKKGCPYCLGLASQTVNYLYGLRSLYSEFPNNGKLTIWGVHPEPHSNCLGCTSQMYVILFGVGTSNNHFNSKFMPKYFTSSTIHKYWHTQ